ncbi:putative diguanylate cyclase AdrA [Planctomycetes bacterium Pan216]|uniref:diguanylate cyclase n=1 Tax=Kolteria novifilia TaxID=2527975 RepID=A0A518B809_9BACT|nr:putative diguanylate cyclase AdrA [Planctomycetes bacterium Pan216]
MVLASPKDEHEFPPADPRVHSAPQTMLAVVVGAILVVGVGYLDHKTDERLAFEIFYLPVVLWASWYGGFIAGLVAAVSSAGTWALNNWFDRPAPLSELLLFWNVSVRLIYFAIFAFMTARLRGAMELNRALSRTDSLTGLANHKSFVEQTNRELVLSRRHKRPMTLAYIDCDHFKVVNDTMGHAAGDTVLQTIGKTMLATVRESDVPARLGGDEFAVLLPETNAANARSVVERLREQLLEMMKDNDWPITFSIGVVTFPTPPESCTAMTRTADKVMYTVKHGSKDDVAYAVAE